MPPRLNVERTTPDCGRGNHKPYRDEDDDLVCRECRRVLHVGMLGVNGMARVGEAMGFVSALASSQTQKE